MMSRTVVLIFHDEDRFVLATRCTGRRSVPVNGILQCAPQIEFDSRALPHLAHNAQMTPALPREAVDHRQPQAGSLPGSCRQAHWRLVWYAAFGAGFAISMPGSVGFVLVGAPATCQPQSRRLAPVPVREHMRRMNAPHTRTIALSTALAAGLALAIAQGAEHWLGFA